MFDNICKFLAENFSVDFANWLLGEPIALTELSPKELSLEPIRADALILLQSDEQVLHIEFQTEPVKYLSEWQITGCEGIVASRKRKCIKL